MNKSIYPQRSQAANAVFAKVVPEKILVVPIDFAKEIHAAQFCRGTGEYLLPEPLRVNNSLSGLDYLEKRIAKNCRKYGFAKSAVVVCGEDPPSFSTNFIHGLKARGLLFVRVNAKEASRLRLSTRASTNALDLNGIAQAAIHHRGYAPADYTAVYAALRQNTRARRQLVKQLTVTKNQIHTQVDVLFPGFLTADDTNPEPFGDASLALLADNFSAVRIQRMKTGTLAKILSKHGIREAQGLAVALQERSGQVAPPPAELAASLSQTVSVFVSLLRQQQASIARLKVNCAQLLAQTPCFLLVTIPGVGIVSAAEFTAELGDPANWPAATLIASYAGIVSRLKNTGHPDRKPAVLGLPRACNRRLKNVLLSVAETVVRYRHPIRRESPAHDGSHPLQVYAQNKQAGNGKYILGTAKKLVRTIGALVKQQMPYLPCGPQPRDLDDANEIFTIEMANAIAVIKAHYRTSDLTTIPDDRNRMRQWIAKTTEDFQLNSK